MDDINEENFQRLQKFGEDVRGEYEKLFTKMWMNLNEEHLEPFGKILLECEGIALKDREQTVESIRKHLQKVMINSLNSFWQGNGVTEALTSLEMCKEKFKTYEGHKWNIEAKSPLERTLPLRMRFKENRLRYVKAQIKYQEDQLKNALEENINLRQQIHNVKQQRIYLMESLGKYRKKFNEAQSEILQLQMRMLGATDENEENLEPNNG
ncbi:uncharacterized protein LOC142220481 [Haematobia irritans]|uniref:uncharacterized protein LOC142220481 n=1 Tax=Haematobia irritans TaxID=7368 RepID=UPI003F503377